MGRTGKIIIAAVALLLVLAITIVIGSRVLAGRTPPPPRVPAALMTPADAPSPPLDALRRAATAAPRDAAVLARLGHGLLRTRDFAAAADAYRESLAIDPAPSAIWSALGEAAIHVDRTHGTAMPPSARKAFDETLARDPNDLRARFYTTIEKDFAGRHDEAVGDWLILLREVPAGSDMDGAIRGAIATSVERNIALIKADMAKAGEEQNKRRLAAGPAKPAALKTSH